MSDLPVREGSVFFYVDPVIHGIGQAAVIRVVPRVGTARQPHAIDDGLSDGLAQF